MTTIRIGELCSRWPGTSALGACLLAFLALCLFGSAFPGCMSDEPADTPEAKPPERLSTAGLLQPEPDESADNSPRLDCHMDFVDEPISVNHLEHGFACTACHGKSVAHGEDEANVTKPDVLFGRMQITPFCQLCHPTHEPGEAYDEFVKEWRGRRRPNGVMLLDDATCTDCHGRHFRLGAG